MGFNNGDEEFSNIPFLLYSPAGYVILAHEIIFLS